MKRLLPYLKGYRKECIAAPVFKLLEASFELLVPLVVASVIDRGISGADTGHILRMCGVMAALAAIGLSCTLIAQYFAARAAIGFTTRLRGALFSHLTRLSYDEIDKMGTSAMITRLSSDANQVQTGLNLALRLLLRSPFIVFGALIMAMTIDVPTALVFAAAIPLLALVVFAVMLVCLPLYRRVQERLDTVLLSIRENLSGARVIRSLAREGEERAAFADETSSLEKEQRRVGRISALLNPATFVIVNLAIALLIYKGAIRVEAGILTQGAVVALYNYMSQILVELIKLANLIITITRSIASAKRIDAALALPEEQDGARTDLDRTAPAVRFEHVSLRYGTSAEDALTDISFEAAAGEIVGIIGGTGSGKTSLINLICGFYQPTGGRTEVFGCPTCEIRRDVLRKTVGIVPQKAVLFAGTVRDNLKYGNPAATDEELIAALETAQGSFVFDKDGLDTEVEEGGKNFSGGQRQRLTVARTLAMRPDILILDDSTSALDYATDSALRRAVRENCAGMTVFLVSQRTASLSGADKILVLHDGELDGVGTHEELLETSEVYREIHLSQYAEVKS